MLDTELGEKEGGRQGQAEAGIDLEPKCCIQCVLSPEKLQRSRLHAVVQCLLFCQQGMLRLPFAVP